VKQVRKPEYKSILHRTHKLDTHTCK